MKLRIPKKHPIAVLNDTERLLRDLSKLHPTPKYVEGYANDLHYSAYKIKREREQLRSALSDAVTALEQGRGFQGEVLEVIAKGKEALGQ